MKLRLVYTCFFSTQCIWEIFFKSKYLLKVCPWPLWCLTLKINMIIFKSYSTCIWRWECTKRSRDASFLNLWNTMYLLINHHQGQHKISCWFVYFAWSFQCQWYLLKDWRENQRIQPKHGNTALCNVFLVPQIYY